MKEGEKRKRKRNSDRNWAVTKERKKEKRFRSRSRSRFVSVSTDKKESNWACNDSFPSSSSSCLWWQICFGLWLRGCICFASCQVKCAKARSPRTSFGTLPPRTILRPLAQMRMQLPRSRDASLDDSNNYTHTHKHTTNIIG